MHDGPAALTAARRASGAAPAHEGCGLEWRGGEPWSALYDDRWFSADSGPDETGHVFLRANRLAGRFAALAGDACFTIGETGFGTGLNFLCAWRLFAGCAPPAARLRFCSVERHPLPAEAIPAALARWPEFAAPAALLAGAWAGARPGPNRWAFDGGRVELLVAIDDVQAALAGWPAAQVDAWFLDGFAPARNPRMWSAAVALAIARASRPGASFATYTAAGWVRRNLAAAGFAVRREAGFGRKRQMSAGELPCPAPGAPGAPGTPG